MKNVKLVVIRDFNSINQAEMAKSFLEREGIYCIIRNEYTSTIYPIGALPAQIVVKEQDVERALKTLNDVMPDEV